MVPEWKTCQIQVEDWLALARQIESPALTPWLRVGNNLFHCCQWIGQDVITRTERRYFGGFYSDQLVCALEIYRISETVVRVRNLFCLPEYRNRGFMRKCLFDGLNYFRPTASRAIAFVTPGGRPFFEACGFSVSELIQARPFEFYDFDSSQYKIEKNETLTFMDFKLEKI